VTPAETTVRTVLVADDHPMVRAALASAVRKRLAPARLIEASAFSETLAAAEAETELDLVLLDLRMPGARGFSGLVALKARAPAAPVLVVSGVDAPDIARRCALYGASGFVGKSAAPGEIEEAIVETAAGGAPGLPPRGAEDMDDEATLAGAVATLSPQQVRVMHLMADGLLNKQIAHELDLSVSTVKGHVTELLRKLGMARRTQLIAALRALEIEDASGGF